jgi:hypothetical protein
LLEHAKLTEEMSATNAGFEFFLVSTLCILIASLLAALYSSLSSTTGDPTSSSGSYWPINFFVDCLFMLSIFVPGSILTTQARRVIKVSNKLRALLKPSDTRRIAQLDSFLVYLMTNNASFKAAGVAIDLGFITKLVITIFTICAFMVQRELAK